MQITSAMRSELIAWLSKVTGEFSYDIETFLLAVNFVDRFLAGTSPYLVAADRLQLLGSAALLVASKKVPSVHLVKSKSSFKSFCLHSNFYRRNLASWTSKSWSALAATPIQPNSFEIWKYGFSRHSSTRTYKRSKERNEINLSFM